MDRARRETALPEARLKGELARTTNQLRLFAEVVEEGSWVDGAHRSGATRPQTAAPRRHPLHAAPPGPGCRFRPSNFPLAFSVAGGDTASALAGGNPVIVKAHSAHPGTSEIGGAGDLPKRPQSLRIASQECSRSCSGSGAQVGSALVQAPSKAVGFTGSLSAGKALMQLAAARPEPIPCFMEMSSSNPFFVLPEALRRRGAQIADRPLRVVHAGRGPVLHQARPVFLPRNAEADALVDELSPHSCAPEQQRPC